MHKQAPARAVGSASRTRLLVWGAEAQPYAARAAYTPEARCGPTGLVVSRDASHSSSHNRAETATAAAIQSTPRGSVDGCAQAHLRTCWPPTCCVCSKRVPKTQARTRARRRPRAVRRHTAQQDQQRANEIFIQSRRINFPESRGSAARQLPGASVHCLRIDTTPRRHRHVHALYWLGSRRWPVTRPGSPLCRALPWAREFTAAVHQVPGSRFGARACAHVCADLWMQRRCSLR